MADPHPVGTELKLDLSVDLFNRLVKVLAPNITKADALRRSVRSNLRRCADLSKIGKVSAGRKRKQIKYTVCEDTYGLTPPQLRACLLESVERAEKMHKDTPPVRGNFEGMKVTYGMEVRTEYIVRRFAFGERCRGYQKGPYHYEEKARHICDKLNSGGAKGYTYKVFVIEERELPS